MAQQKFWNIDYSTLCKQSTFELIGGSPPTHGRLQHHYHNATLLLLLPYSISEYSYSANSISILAF